MFNICLSVFAICRTSLFEVSAVHGTLSNVHRIHLCVGEDFRMNLKELLINWVSLTI